MRQDRANPCEILRRGGSGHAAGCKTAAPRRLAVSRQRLTKYGSCVDEKLVKRNLTEHQKKINHFSSGSRFLVNCLLFKGLIRWLGCGCYCPTPNYNRSRANCCFLYQTNEFEFCPTCKILAHFEVKNSECSHVYCRNCKFAFIKDHQASVPCWCWAASCYCDFSCCPRPGRLEELYAHGYAKSPLCWCSYIDD